MTLGVLTGKHLISFANSDKRYNIWDGAVSSGKTVDCNLRWVDFCLSGPPGALLMVGKTERTLKRNVLDILIKDFGNAVRQVGPEVYIYGRKIYLVGANDERSEQKIRGLSLVGVYCDEITLFPESFYKMLITRLREPGAQLFATTNPDTPTHYLLKDLLENPELKDDLTRWQFTIDDNPYLNKEYVATMKKSYPVGSLWYKRYIQGLWVAAEGMIYDMFDEKIHVYDEHTEKYDKYYLAIDYGTANPFVAILFGIIKGKDNGDWVCAIKEYYYDGKTSQKQKTDAEYSKELKEYFKDYKISEVLVDPSALSFITQLRRDGWQVRQAKNDVLDGIRTVSTFLSTERLYIHKDCKNTIKEFYSYVWDESKQERGEDAPKKENDHCFIAGTLVTTDKGNIPIEHLKKGDLVLTRKGYYPIKTVGCTNKNAEIWKLKLSDGRELYSTGYHPIFIKGKGYIPLDTIRYGDCCLCLKPLYLMGSSLEDTRTQKTKIGGHISGVQKTISKKVFDIFTKKSGNLLMEKSQKDIVFITKMETHLITQLKILIASLVKNIQVIIQKSGWERTKSKLKTTWIQLDHLQKNGTHQPLEENGTENTEFLHIQKGNISPKYVRFVVRNIPQEIEREDLGSVQTIVNQHTADINKKTSLIGYAPFAAKSSLVTNTSKQRVALNPVVVSYIGKTNLKLPVYNLEVDGEPEYFANGILVHNCMDACRYCIFTLYGKGEVQVIKRFL